MIKRRRAVIRRRPDVSWRWAWDCEDNCRDPSTIRRRHFVVWAAYTAEPEFEQPGGNQAPACYDPAPAGCVLVMGEGIAAKLYRRRRSVSVQLFREMNCTTRRLYMEEDIP